MTWDPDAPLSQLDTALLVYTEIKGQDAALAYLNREAERIRAYQHLLITQRRDNLNLAAKAEADARALAVIDELETQVRELRDALEFYADEDHWRPLKGGRQARAVADRGQRAREVLNALYGDETAAEEEGHE
jgi:hypothetical protein